MKFVIYDKLTNNYIYPDSPGARYYSISLSGEVYNYHNGSGGDDYEVAEYLESSMPSFLTLLDELIDPNYWSRVNQRHTDRELILEVNVAGFDKKQIKVNVEGAFLTVTAKDEKRNLQEDFYLAPEDDVEKITTHLKNGLLTISIPRRVCKGIPVVEKHYPFCSLAPPND